MHPFRFELQIGPASADGVRSLPQAAEDPGFDATHTWDHVGEDWAHLAPVIAIRRVPNTEHRRHKHLNNRAENWQLPPRMRVRVPALQIPYIGYSSQLSLLPEYEDPTARSACLC